MQKLFSMFPAGAPGIALLLMRVCVAATLFVDQQGRPAMPASQWIFVLLVIATGSLSLGFFTPLFCLFSALFELSSLLSPHNDGALTVVLATLNAAAMGLLGPGAYSLDARLFGRRVVVLPTHPTE